MIKKDFIKIMNALEAQYRHDEKYSSKLEEVFSTEDCLMYDNGELVECIVSFLSSNFKEPSKAEESINYYMFDFDFGSESEVVSDAEKLWQLLLAECGLKESKSNQGLKDKEVNLSEVEMMLRNVNNLVDMYKRTLLSKGLDSELQNIVNALYINIDFLKGITIQDYRKDLDLVNRRSTTDKPRVQRGVTITKVRINE